MKLSQAIFAISIVTTQSAFAQIAECDLLASSPLDPQKQSAGVSFNKLDHIAAVPACKVAVTENKQAPRLWFQYGRSLEKAKKLPDSIIAYQEAAKLGSGAAYNNLGELYRDGKGFEVNLKTAEEYFQKASDLNSIEGKDNLLKLQAKNKPSIPNQATPALAAANNEKIKKEPIELQNNNKSASNVSKNIDSWNFLKGMCIYKSRTIDANGKSLDVSIDDCSEQVLNSRPKNQEINYYIYGEDVVDSVLAPIKTSYSPNFAGYKTKIKYEKSSNKNALLTTEGPTDCADVFEYVLVDNILTRRLIKQILTGCTDFVKSTAKDRYNAQSVPLQLMFIQGKNKFSILDQTPQAQAEVSNEKLKKEQTEYLQTKKTDEDKRTVDNGNKSVTANVKSPVYVSKTQWRSILNLSVNYENSMSNTIMYLDPQSLKDIDSKIKEAFFKAQDWKSKDIDIKKVQMNCQSKTYKIVEGQNWLITPEKIERKVDQQIGSVVERKIPETMELGKPIAQSSWKLIEDEKAYDLYFSRRYFEAICLNNYSEQYKNERIK